MSVAGPSRLPAVASSLANIRAIRPPVPANLAETLSKVRSDIFLTLHNPTGARLGTKYLRKQLKGPAIARYYPHSILPRFKNINKLSPYNPYANWQGVPSEKLPVKISKTTGKVVPWKSEQYPYDPNVWPEDVRALFLDLDEVSETRTQDKEDLDFVRAARRYKAQRAKENAARAEGQQRLLIDGIEPGSAFIQDPREKRRQERVARKRRLGKGPPPKGQWSWLSKA